MQIVADTQSWQKGNIFVAQGNVSVNVNGGIIEADLIKINKLEKTLTAIGNLTFSRGAQYFSASYFTYNLEKKRGRAERCIWSN